jgi:GDP-L-fucose synthase
MTGPLEPTSAAYATAKLAGIQLVRAYRDQYGAPFASAILPDVFGPGDTFDPADAHVIPALIQRMHVAKQHGLPAVTVWGSGNPRREFVYADDAARACLFLMDRYDGPGPINIGCGSDVSIAEVALLIREVVDYAGELVFDTTKPDGAPRKLLDSEELRSLGWQPRTEFRDAIAETYRWYLAQGGAHD